jgi:hypothetical protein
VAIGAPVGCREIHAKRAKQNHLGSKVVTSIQEILFLRDSVNQPA